MSRFHEMLIFSIPYITPGAAAAMPEEQIMECLLRHYRMDWGVVGEEDWAANDRAAEDGDRILSAYPIDPEKPCEGFGDNTLWIITDADGHTTTVLLPSEY